MLMKSPLGTPINRAHPLARGLVGCWLMNEGAGSKIYDLSGNVNTGTFGNETYWTPGRNGPAIGFDGVNDYASMGDVTFLDGLTTASWSWWMKVITPPTLETSVFRKDSAWIPLQFIEAGTLWRSIVWTSSGRLTWEHDVTITTAEWTYLTLTYDGANVRLYKNGVLDKGPQALTGTLNNSANPLVLGSTGSAEPFNGLIDDVRTYNRALSAQEAQQLYLNPYAMFEQYPVWRDYVAAAVGNRRRRLLLTRRAA